MTFTDSEIAEHMKVIEDVFWSRRRPPTHLRDKVREGQRIEARTIELFIVRPVFSCPGKQVEESIAKSPAHAALASLAHLLETGGRQLAPLSALFRGAHIGGSPSHH